MIAKNLRASQLAALTLKSRVPCANTHKIFYSSLTKPLSFKAGTRPLRRTLLDSPSKPLPIRSVRNCSHKRNMYNLQEGTEGGCMNVAEAREILPTNVKPLHYDLTLEPDFEKFTYEGKVVIEYVQSRI